MDFYEVLAQVIEILQREERTSYRALKRQFELDDEYLEDLKIELIEVRECAVDHDNRMLVWTGHTESTSSPAQSIHQGEEAESRFHAVLPAVIAFLQREERATYRELRHAFGLDDVLLKDIRKVLQFKRLAIDEGDEGLVWTGKAQPNVLPAVSAPIQQLIQDVVEGTSLVTPPLTPLVTETETQTNGPTTLSEPLHTDVPPDESVTMPARTRSTPEAERRQLTVMFCDLSDSTKLSQQLDPEDLREVVRAYQETAAEVIERYEGHIAQYLGDGLLVYQGWPQAHENDAERAVYTGLEIPEAIARLNTHLEADYGVQLAVRMGIHTGLVVVGEMGGGDRHENLALGETPNIAARLEGLAPPNTVVISPVTAQLVQRSFVLEELGLHELKGVAEPMRLYAVVGSREVDHDEDEAMLSGGFVALVGRDEEIGLLLRRWEQSKEGLGQAVLISGTGGIGKSALTEVLRAHIRDEGLPRITFRCSSYHQNSALYPVIVHIERVLDLQREDTAATKLDKLEQGLQGYSLPRDEVVPLLAALLSVPLDDRYPTPTLSPQQQKQQTLDALVAWMFEEAERQPTLVAWEDLHWADPSTLEYLGLVLEQTPTVAMLHVLTYRPEFEPPWAMRSHMTPLTLNRLERPQVEALITHLARGKALPSEVIQHIVAKTDGVPLYVEELTKMLLDSDFLRQDGDQYVLTGPLLSVAIPDTLQDSLMARLDQMHTAKEVAQLGAVLGRQFSYDMLQAIAMQDEEILQAGLSQLVKAELLYQRGRPPQAKYIFKHALIQDAAYASLLKSTRQRVHQQIAQLLEARFPELVETQPELVAYHYTEAGQHSHAMPYWQRAGERAVQRSSFREAISHCRWGLELIPMLPQTLACVQQELSLHMILGPALIATKGVSAPEVEETYLHARALCRQLEDTSHLFQVVAGLWRFYNNHADLPMAQELGEELLTLAERQGEPMWLVEGHTALAYTLSIRGEFTIARTHLEQGIVLPAAPQDRSMGLYVGFIPGVQCRTYLATVLWTLGYPDQARQRADEAVTLARELKHPHSLTYALWWQGRLHLLCGDRQVADEQIATAVTLATEHGFPLWVALGMILRGQSMVIQGQGAEGVEVLRQGIMDNVAMGNRMIGVCFLDLLLDAYQKMEHPDEGLRAAAEGLVAGEETGIHFNKAELYRLQGELLRQADGRWQMAELTPEECFMRALAVAREQQAKSWELRAATSLARLWQQQGKCVEALELLAPVYDWFTEGFDTADLQDAKALLDALPE